jgi:hypothetical protein
LSLFSKYFLEIHEKLTIFNKEICAIVQKLKKIYYIQADGGAKNCSCRLCGI